MRMSMGRGFAFVLALGFSCSVGCAPASEEGPESSSSELGARAADSTGMGPLPIASAEYRFPAAVDPDVLPSRPTEIWAQLYRPKTLAPNEKHPVLVFLHGNHGTCGRGTNPRVDDSVQYTMQGTCPPGYVVTPNHLGYAYLAERLASWGYIVVSINANRGITAGGGTPGDFGLNLARGRLVLKHLQLLSEWNARAGRTPVSLGVDLVGKLDLGNVGMMGHSRGGEGVRAAYVQYGDEGSPWPARIKSPLGVKAIFEIGPVDGQTSRTLNALGTAWNVLLPMCDGDVSNLQGMRPFDRMLAAASEPTARPKGMFAVWGANHNFYNTEWQQSDSRGCQGTGHLPLFERGQSASTKQQSTGLHALMGFFRAHVGAKTQLALNDAYDPLFQVPQVLDAIARVERAYADAAQGSNVRVLEDFTRPAGTSLAGFPTLSRNVTVTHGGVSEHDPVLKAASIRWSSATSDTYFEVPWAAAAKGIDVSAMQTLDFRVSRHSSASTDPLNFRIRLVNGDGTLSVARDLRDYVDLATYGGHSVLQTVRIPLAAFTGAKAGSVRGVRFVFDDTKAGAIYLTSIRVSRSTLPTKGGQVVPPAPTLPQDAPGTPHETVTVPTGNNVNALRARPTNEVEVELESQFAFPVANDLARLRIGERDVLLSQYTDEGDTHRIVFKIAPDELDGLVDGAPMKVRYGEDLATYEWDFGVFQKAAIQR